MHTKQIIMGLLVGIVLIMGACTPASAPSSPAAPVSKPQPQGFTISELNVPDLQASSGDGLEIGVTVTNNGKEESTHKLVLQIDDAIVQTRDVTLAAGASRYVIFTINIHQIGTHKITVDDISRDLYWPGPN